MRYWRSENSLATVQNSGPKFRSFIIMLQLPYTILLPLLTILNEKPVYIISFMSYMGTYEHIIFIDLLPTSMAS